MATPASRSQAVNPRGPRLFYSPEAEAIKAEIVAVGRKLWQRAVRRRQRRQHLVPPRPERSPLHADAGQQGRPAARGPLPGGPRRQPARRLAPAHERDPDAPRDLQGRAGGEGRRALPPAARHRLRHHRPRSADLDHPRVRGVHRQVRGVALRDSRHAEVRRDGAAVSCRTTTRCCSRTTGSSAGPTP